MPAMTTEDPASDEITIDEAMQLSGKSRVALMKLKARGKLKGRVVLVERTQRNRKVMFRRDEIEALAGRET